MAEVSLTRKACITIATNLTKPGITTLSKGNNLLRLPRKRPNLRSKLLKLLLHLKHHKKAQDALSILSFLPKEGLMLQGHKLLRSPRVRPPICLLVKDQMRLNHHLRKARLLRLLLLSLVPPKRVMLL